jgi:outer membrane autotransporter protein
VTVENSGTVTGSVSLRDQFDTGTNTFKNMLGGVFNMGSFVYLGDGNDLTNAGTLSPGGVNNVAKTTVTGDLVQHAGGTMLIDVDGNTNKADRIDVTGTADLAGTVTVNVINPVSTDQQFTILSAAVGVTNSGLTLFGGLPLGFSLLYPNANDVVLGVTVDFTLDEKGLNRNQTALAENLNAIIDAGAGGVSPVTNALLGITDLDQYRSALNQLLPEHYLNLQAATLFSAENFAQSLMSCREREGAYAIIAEGQCLWAEIDANRYDQDGTSEQVSTGEDSYRFSAGGQVGLSDQVHLGFALRYETLDQDTGNFASSDGERAHAGAALKYNEGPMLLAAAVSAGRTWYDTDRNFSFGGFSDGASSSHEVDYVNGVLRAAYLMPLGNFYLKPIADFNVAHVSSDGFTEAGGGGAALTVNGADGTYFSFSPTVEAGTEWRMASGTLVRPFIGGGLTWYSDTAFSGAFSFADGPEEAGSFVTRTSIDEVVGNVAAGIDILGADGFDLRLRYDGAFGETITNQSLGLRAAVQF